MWAPTTQPQLPRASGMTGRSFARLGLSEAVEPYFPLVDFDRGGVPF